jgi:hypothetical protein
MVLPFERVLPVEPVELPVAAPALDPPAELPPPAAPPALCASAREQLLSKMLITNDVIFITDPLVLSICGTSRQFATIGFVPEDRSAAGTITNVRRLS